MLLLLIISVHPVRSLLQKSGTLVPVLTAKQYLQITRSIVQQQSPTEDSTFQHFLLFYSQCLDKIPEVKKLTLLRRLFTSEKLDHKTLASLSAEGLQNLGLLVATCLHLVKPDSLTAQVNKIFGSLSGDMISNSSAPSVVVSLQIGMALVHSDLVRNPRSSK